MLPAAAHAQARLTGADIVGAVSDDSGGPIPAATIQAKNLETGVLRTATVDAHGRYRIAALPPGRYRLTAEAVGFQPRSMDDVSLALGQQAGIDFRLRVARGGGEVTVTAESGGLDVATTAVASVLGRTQIDNLPVNGRDFLSFTLLTPGVVTDRSPSQGALAASGLSFVGQRARSNNVMVDGFDDNEVVQGAVAATYSQEAVQEFQVLTSAYSAEFGSASGGVINIVTRSGTNAFHGSAFGYFRDDALNARDHFEKYDVSGNPIDVPKAPFSQKQWGATLGGPLRAERTFFFLSFEKLDIGANNFVTIDPATAAVFRDEGFPVTLGAVPYQVASTQFLAKLDHQWSGSRRFTLRGQVSDRTNGNVVPFGGTVAESAGATLHRKDWTVSGAETDVFGGGLVNEARMQFGRGDQSIRSLDCDGPCDGPFAGGPQVAVRGVATVGRAGTIPDSSTLDRFQLGDTVSRSLGAHLVKAGADVIRYFDGEREVPSFFGGTYQFTGLQDLEAGRPTTYNRGYGAYTVGESSTNLALFAQEEWRIRPRLTLKAGLRYQKEFFPSLRHTVPVPGGAPFTYDVPPDNNNLAPRLALAFDPKGDRRTSLHASCGVFFEDQRLALRPFAALNTGTADGFRQITLNAAGAPGRTAADAWNDPDHTFPEPTTPYASAMYVMSPRLQTPFTRQAAVGFEHAVGRSIAITADFTYVRGRHLVGLLNYNPLVRALGPGRRPSDVDGRRGTSGSVFQFTDNGETWYRGLLVSIGKRLSGRSQWLVSYTLSKAEDTTPDQFGLLVRADDDGLGRNPADPTGLPLGFDPLREKGAAPGDQRHRLVASGLYRLPWDVQISGIVTVASGRPFTPFASFDFNGDGLLFDRARRDPADPATAVARGSETMPMQANVDARLSRRFALGNRVALEAIVEAFNLFNRTNYSEVNDSFGPGSFPSQPLPTYGLFNKALPPRQAQLALRLTF